MYSGVAPSLAARLTAAPAPSKALLQRKQQLSATEALRNQLRQHQAERDAEREYAEREYAEREPHAERERSTAAASRAVVAAAAAPRCVGAAGSLVGKKHAIMDELGLSGNMPTVAADAADALDIERSGKKAAELINECYRELFGSETEKNAIMHELGLSTFSAADAADALNIDPDGKEVTELIEECYLKLFG